MGERPDFTVARVDADGRIAVLTDRFAQTWPDETVVEEVQVEKAGGAWQLVISGIEKAGTSVSYNIPVEFTPDGSLRMVAASDDVTKAAAVNKCTGHNCSRCKWSGFSCSCEIGSGHCDHEVIVGFAPADNVFLKA